MWTASYPSSKGGTRASSSSQTTRASQASQRACWPTCTTCSRAIGQAPMNSEAQAMQLRIVECIAKVGLWPDLRRRILLCIEKQLIPPRVPCHFHTASSDNKTRTSVFAILVNRLIMSQRPCEGGSPASCAPQNCTVPFRRRWCGFHLARLRVLMSTAREAHPHLARRRLDCHP